MRGIEEAGRGVGAEGRETASSPLVLGLDGGGTGTKAILCDAAGRVLGRGLAGPSNLKAVGRSTAFESALNATRNAFRNAGLELAPLAAACLGLAGVGRPEDRFEWRDWPRSVGLTIERLRVVHDGEIVLAAGADDAGDGLALIAGTGSIAFGRRGETHARCGGWGYRIGDEGSAYHVARHALTILSRRADGRETPPRPDRLTAVLLDHLRCDSVDALVHVVHAPEFDRTQTADLARVVLEQACDEPGLLDRLLDPAAEALAELVLTTARKLRWWKETDSIHRVLPPPLAIAGSFLIEVEPLRLKVLRRIEQAGLQVEPRVIQEPALGAVRLARWDLHADMTTPPQP